MKKTTLRILFTPNCNRDCKLCCNKSIDLENLPVYDNLDYDEVIITGGEPMLYRKELQGFLRAIRPLVKGKIILYTATYKRETITKFINEGLIDGLTITIHTKRDLSSFFMLDSYLEVYKQKDIDIRVNTFIDTPQYGYFMDAKIKKIEWQKDCPVPSNEVFVRAF